MCIVVEISLYNQICIIYITNTVNGVDIIVTVLI